MNALPEPSRTASGRSAFWRAGLALLALGAAAGAISEAWAWSEEQERLADFLASAAPLALSPSVAAEVRRELDPARARLRAARTVFAAELKRRPETVAAAGDLAGSVRRLDRVASLAALSWRELPAAWEGGLVLGGATYLARLRAHDDRLVSRYRDWEAPLEAARELAPGRLETQVLLAHAYAQLWPVLSAQKRRTARELVRRGLQDREARRDLLPAWLAIAGSRDQALAALPADPEAWDELFVLYGQKPDWPGMLAVRAGRRRVLEKRLTADLEAARERVRQGAFGPAREIYLEIAVRAEGSAAGADLLERALDECPPGIAGARTSELLSAQLGWILDSYRFARLPISADALARLGRLAGESDRPTAALTAIAAGDLSRARILERQSDDPTTEAWGELQVAKAEALAAPATKDEALAALALLSRERDDLPTTWRARKAVARATGDAALERRADERLAELAATAWPAFAWTFRKSRARLELIAASPGSGFDVAIDEVATGSAVVDVRLDGALLGSFLATAGKPLALPAAVAPGIHLLEVTVVAGGTVLPGGVRLLPPAAGTPVAVALR